MCRLYIIGTGALLDSVEAVLAYARTMTWKGLNPTVELVTNIYHSGVKLTQEAMHKIEKQIERLSGFITTQQTSQNHRLIIKPVIPASHPHPGFSSPLIRFL
ncbi:hypothetical protein C2W62_31035 [Candidatus Entotheonella serta]|nr:hypothetical protein C2W62_31035 [Candidatus Entotheonella serta]